MSVKWVDNHSRERAEHAEKRRRGGCVHWISFSQYAFHYIHSATTHPHTNQHYNMTLFLLWVILVYKFINACMIIMGNSKFHHLSSAAHLHISLGGHCGCGAHWLPCSSASSPFWCQTPLHRLLPSLQQQGKSSWLRHCMLKWYTWREISKEKTKKGRRGCRQLGEKGNSNWFWFVIQLINNQPLFSFTRCLPY